MSRPSKASPHDSLGAQRRIAFGATASTLGIGWTGTSESLAGALVVLISLIALIYAIHAYGRLGFDPGP